MAKPARKKSAKTAPPLRFDFNAAVRKAKQDHPGLKKNALFIDAANDDWEHIEETLDRLAVDEEDIGSIRKTVKDAVRLKTSFHIAVTRGGEEQPFSAVVFHPDKHPLYGAEKGAIDDAGTFDHETGHALSPDEDGTPAENIADAYAALRHLQRTGGETESLEYCAWKRALIFLTTGATTHVTNFTLDKIICDAKTADFLSLTPNETAAIAKAYAKANTPDKKALKKLAEDFRPLRRLPLQEVFKKLARITLAAKEDSPTFHLGARVLQGALDKKGAVIDGKPVKLEGRAWDKVRERLNARLKGLPKGHPLRKIP